jgi:Terpene cyclase DEP1
MTLSKLHERAYFGLALVGLLLTWYFNIRFFAGGGSMAPGSFFASAFANPLTTAITLDVYWSALVFSAWAVAERAEPFAPSPWAYVVLCFAVGLAFALPLYLGRRRQLTRAASPDDSFRSTPRSGI